jgi:hypothetical protein
MVYVAQITDSILETMSDEEIQLAIDDVDAFTAILTPKLEAELSPNQVFKNIWSNTVETDASGKTTGSLNIQPQ